MKRYYFQDLCAHLRAELVAEALTVSRAFRQDADVVMEDIDYYINVHNRRQAIPQWLRLMRAYRYSR